MKFKEVLKISWWPVLIASMCCLAPVVVVLFGLGTLSFAIALEGLLYGELRLMFEVAGVLLLAASLFFYFRHTKGICTIDEAKKRRNEIINISLTVFFMSVLIYFVWLYGVVEIIGSMLKIW